MDNLFVLTYYQKLGKILRENYIMNITVHNNGIDMSRSQNYCKVNGKGTLHFFLLHCVRIYNLRIRFLLGV